MSNSFYTRIMDYRIFPPTGLLEAQIRMPLSKSESARALIIRALTPDAPMPEPELADCDDTRALQAALASDSDTIDIGAAGTAMRFITAYMAAQPGRKVTVDGSERMRERPIGVLVDALRRLGADIEYLGEEGFPPLHITGCRLHGGTVNVDASISSQYVSALMMIAPLMETGLVIELDGRVSSAPYITLTAAMMSRAGIDIEVMPMSVRIAPGVYEPTVFRIGGDWSAASYWYEIEALTSGFITLEGLDEESVQGDHSVVDLFRQLGVVTEPSEETPGALDLCGSPDPSPRLIYDFSQTPDLAQTAAVTCAMTGIPFRFSGLESLRIKETDRVAAIATELLKIGVSVDTETSGVMEWDGRRHPIREVPAFDTYADHRMAMSLAPVSCYIPGIIIRNAEVVAKSYPDFFRHLTDAGFLVVDALTPAEEIEEMLIRRENEEE